MEIEKEAPEQEAGGFSNTYSTKKVDPASGEAVFQEAKRRLLDINHWKDYAGTGSAEFQLTDQHGNIVERDPATGDHFRINIPGPGNEAGNGYDWVRVEEVREENEESNIFCMTVRPAPDPGDNAGDTAHFFSDSATSTFTVSRKGDEVTVAVLGRNELPNTSVEKGTNKLRNAAVATGAITIFSKIQWKKLVNGILDF